ncbi:MAG TPA: homoserine O-acetyltransferase [Cytophagales bacterium]|nr:homoserine O-acetyltransferase [Cytophagales bacterium]
MNIAELEIKIKNNDTRLKEQFFQYKHTFPLESGKSLPEFQLCYSTWGKLNESKDNVIWICHALTANSDAEDWWCGLFGKGNFFDPEKYFIVCANVLGGCYGSTGPLSINPETGKPYYHSFPTLTIRDIVLAFDLLREDLGINTIHTVIGGSLGGQQALEWSVLRPGLFEHQILIATNAKHSPWGIAFNESQRLAINADSTWNEDHELAGQEGLKAARSIALLSYRNYHTYQEKQSEDTESKFDGFRASSYQKYQGEKLVKRFNAFTYWVLSKTMDSHNIARGRKSCEEVLKENKTSSLVIGIKSDVLFPIEEQTFIHENLSNSTFKEIDSLYGHDGFLIETDQINKIFEDYFKSKALISKK